MSTPRVAKRPPAAFSSGEVALAFALAVAVEMGLFVLIVGAGSNLHIKPKDTPPPEPVPMKVLPVLDDAPLLKLGGKVKPKLPDMWKKNPPVQRFEEKSAPSPQAEKTPEAIPTSPVAIKDASAPPPDAEVAKEVDQVLLDAGPDAAPTVEGEGAADGVKEGTETDPLKARAVSQYNSKIHAWFNARFRQPEIPCEELKGLRASVSVSVSGERTVGSFSITRPSGNAAFDERVQSTMAGAQGQELPPPPPLYPDILGSQLAFSFGGKCND